MRCEECGDEIDPETDRHLVLQEELVAPELGLERAEGGAFCEACMEPRAAKIGPE